MRSLQELLNRQKEIDACVQLVYRLDRLEAIGEAKAGEVDGLLSDLRGRLDRLEGVQ